MLTESHVYPSLKLSKSSTENLEVLFDSQFGKVSQCDLTHFLIVEFQGVKLSLNFDAFFALKTQLQSIDLDKMVMDNKGVELIMPSQTTRCFALCPHGIFNFRSLVEGAYTMLLLNSIIYKRITNPSIFDCLV